MVNSTDRQIFIILEKKKKNYIPQGKKITFFFWIMPCYYTILFGSLFNPNIFVYDKLSKTSQYYSISLYLK